MNEMNEHEFAYFKTTRGISIGVEPEFLTDQSDSSKNIYSFSYTVVFENLGVDAVQLINRHWRVFSGDRQLADVKGPGVVGENPILQPGEAYTYSSGATIADPIGMMSGSYTFRNEAGEFFDVEVPNFDLVSPDVMQ